MAAKRYELLGQTSRDMRDKAQSVRPTFVSLKEDVYLFKAGSKGYDVKVTFPWSKPDDFDVRLSCTCPVWQFQGPEYHAQREDYLLGSPKGTASTPEVRDPKRHNKLCKHAVAVLRRLDRYIKTEF